MFASFAAAEPLVQLEPIVEVNDDLRADALISGNWLVGVHTRADRADDVPRLYSHVSSEWAGKAVCVRVIGENGRYNALYPYQMPNSWEGGLVEFIYPTQHPDFVSNIDDSNSGVAVHEGDCDSISQTFVPVLWNALDSPKANADGQVELVLNINAGRADSVFGAATSGDVTIEMTCDPTTARGVGFNYQCVFAVPRELSATLDVSIERLRFGRAAPPRTATIKLFPPADP
ncbi:hypothetical protein [Cognatishimia sp. MH4019]|uniref:hypothetical protein n=1 Tax=Cognatishimia sp. MH4019 TaxID=2854030 RepID=UPI001CD33919|nr:hypothetical protein [Cognatishimia sp. MH4019]